MKKIFILLFSFTVLFACKKEINYSDLQEEDIQSEEFDPYLMEISDNDDATTFYDATGEYPDGTYCAEVEYYNPNTGTRSTYELDVEVENGDLTQIDWPNGGWLDETHFSPENISGGEVSFTSDRGYRYTITLGDYGGGCYSGGRMLQNVVNNDIAEEEQQKADETCPECGFSKFASDDYCSSCKRKLTCPECGRSKNKYDELCYSCERKAREEEESEN